MTTFYLGEAHRKFSLDVEIFKTKFHLNGKKRAEIHLRPEVKYECHVTNFSG